MSIKLSMHCIPVGGRESININSEINLSSKMCIHLSIAIEYLSRVFQLFLCTCSIHIYWNFHYMCMYKATYMYQSRFNVQRA